jgi:uronate dehydrogenase
MTKVVVTGANGFVGRALCKSLVGAGYSTIGTVRTHGRVDASTRCAYAITGDIDRTTNWFSCLNAADAVVHLAAQANEEAPWEKLLNDNVVSTHAVFEAARRAGVGRVVFASTNHVTGSYPASMNVGPDTPVRPDGLYAATKVFGEALGHVYAHRHGLAVACLRIGSFRQRPADLRELSTWLSPRDCVQLVRRCLELPELDFIVVYGISANTRRYWSDEGWRNLGYRPEDDAEAFAAGIESPAVGSHQ